MKYYYLILWMVVVYVVYGQTSVLIVDEDAIVKGNAQLDAYLPLLKDKRVGVVANACSKIGDRHLVDTLLKHRVNITRIFSPEHGFRGNADAGEKVRDTVDTKTSIVVVSLYGKYKAPKESDMREVDVVLFDLQDVGVRFYTYISTLYYVLKSCALYHKPLVVLDRPNPNGFYIDGPVLDTNFRSFVGIVPVPLVYGMTIGELAIMMNTEPLYKPTSQSAELTVIPLKNYTHRMLVKMRSVPSPNLSSWQSIILYPSLGLFEGTVVSVGRGTSRPFQVLGHPKYSFKKFCFTPQSNRISKHPKYEGIECCGIDLSDDDYLKNHPQKINLQWLIHFYRTLRVKNFFDKNFNYHSGNAQLKKDIIDGLDEEAIRKKWEKGIEGFKEVRKRYLLYAD